MCGLIPGSSDRFSLKESTKKEEQTDLRPHEEDRFVDSGFPRRVDWI